MSRELVRYEPGADLADYPDGADLIVSRSDMVALADGGDNRQLDRAARQECEQSLRQLWGREYEQRLEMNWQVLSSEFGAELAIDLLEARMADGRRVADEPRFSAGLNELICLAVAGLRATGQGAEQGSLDDQKREIENLMVTDIARYWREGWDRRYASVLRELGYGEEDT